MTSRLSGQPHDHTHVTPELHDTLEQLDSATNYADWVGDVLTPFVTGDVLELGAGSGTLTERFLPLATTLVAVEPSTRLASELSAKLADDARVTVVVGELDAVGPGARFDTAVLVNVLEHIEQDESTLVALHDTLRPLGRVVLFVPAFEVLYSAFDRQIGHHRRYRRKDLTAKLRRAGFDIEQVRYFNSLGFFLWLVGIRMLRMRPAQSRFTGLFDRHVVPTLARLESALSPPFGQSIVCVGRKPG